MSLAQIQYPPPTEKGLEEWMHAHVRHHEALIGAVDTTFGVKLELLPIYPVGKDSLSTWSRAHQSAHDALANILGFAGTDLTGVDFSDQRKLDGWMFEHFIQHQAAAEACGLPV